MGKRGFDSNLLIKIFYFLKAKQQKKKLLSNQRKQLRDLSSNKNYWLDNSLAAENPERVFAISEQIERFF